MYSQKLGLDVEEETGGVDPFDYCYRRTLERITVTHQVWYVWGRPRWIIIIFGFSGKRRNEFSKTCLNTVGD